MARNPECLASYEIANQWRERCLLVDKSLLWPDLEDPTWTLKNISDLLTAFLGSPDPGHESFTTKWRRQLEDQSEAVHRVAADVIAVYVLFTTRGVMGPNAKRSLINEVASWKAGTFPESETLDAALSCGLGHPGMFYHNRGRPWQVAFFLDFAKRAKEQAVDVFNIEETRELAAQSYKSGSTAAGAKNILFHLLFPDRFESIASRDHKLRIVSNLGAGMSLPEDIDDAIYEIRQSLSKDLGRDIGFYDGDVYPRWHPATETPNPPAPPHPPTVVPTRRVWVEKANSWQSKSDPTFRSGNVFLYPTKDAGGHDIFHSLGELRVGDVIVHLFDTKTFTQRSVVGESAIEIDGTPHGYPGQQYLVRLTNQEKVVPELEWTAVKEQIGPRLLDFGMSCEEKLFYLPSEGLPLRSFEGVTVAPTSLIDILNEASNELTGFDLLPPGWPEDDGLAGLARAVFMKRAELAVTDELLKAKRQIIFEGPPGSGKTFVARLFARYLAGLPLEGPPDPQVEIVQFHQSYGYEDFVAGIRPRTTPEGNIRYDVQPGIFIEMCQRAQANPDKKFVLIIDEINRGNLSRIFGELLYALEYRDEPVRIQYPDMLGDESADHLTIPKNLFLIGTMNSTDRSLAMIDYALRRRFYFWKLMPVIGGEAPVLAGWLRAKGIEELVAARVLAAFVAVNSRIAELLNPDFQIGHSYFMVDGIGHPATLQTVWRHALLPLLEEYFHNRRDREALIDELRLIVLSGVTSD